MISENTILTIYPDIGNSYDIILSGYYDDEAIETWISEHAKNVSSWKRNKENKYERINLNEFKKIKKGDHIVICENGIFSEKVASTDAFYNVDADEPDWEVMCKGGPWVCWDSVYVRM